MESGSNTGSKVLSFAFLKGITDDFSEDRLLGKGAFGMVYKGRLPDGKEIAVKKLLAPTPVQDSQFQNEVGCLMEVKHENIVKLLGYCYETQNEVVQRNGKFVLSETVNKLLCYEYMRKGSLEKHLFEGPCVLDWDMRFKIIKGICKGLQCLHELRRPIIHLDLKPENILLDDNMVPKIADFGLSRLFGEEQTRTCTETVRGSIGYIAPEYLCRGEISAMSDIYSLGLLIIEITTGEKNCSNMQQDMSAKNYIENVGKNWIHSSHIESNYPTLDKDRLEQVKKCIYIGLKCVEANRNARPSAREIVNRLNEGGSGSLLDKFSRFGRAWRVGGLF